MTNSLARLAVLVGSFAFAQWSWAVAYGNYPGLSSMIGDSQSIVVVSILSGPNVPRTTSENAWAVQRVKVLSVLKGSLREQDEIDVELMPFLLFPTSTYLGIGDFPIYERYVLFIARDYWFPGHKYSIVNAVGSAFWIPRSADVSNLKPGDVRGNIEVLVNAALSYSRSREETLEQCIHQYLSDAPDSHDTIACR
jgi:hypothetical protein